MSPEDSTQIDPTSTSPPKERRFKLSRACDRCRRRRIKCDEGHPCQSCLSSHSACTFEEPGKRTQHTKSKRTATLEDRMHHLETLIQSIPSSIFAHSQANAQASSSSSSSSSSPTPLMPHDYLSAIPQAAFSLAPLTNPSNHFAQPRTSHSYMYWDEQGCKRWQGETSGLPLLDTLFDRVASRDSAEWHADCSGDQSENGGAHPSTSSASACEWFPDRSPPRVDTVNPETLWKIVTSCISSDLMDTLVQCYLSTTSHLMPFLHIPTFLADYANPLKWGEPGFVSFILAICCLSSRHVDDPRLLNASSPVTTWFDLFTRLRTLPSADRPTLYTVQAVLVAAVYAVGLGKLSKAFALLSESITLSLDAGLHRSTDAYASITASEDEIRKRTFWCVYMWDKQASATFGRPPLLRLRDCDVGEPSAVDDEYITLESVGQQPPGTPSRLEAFVAAVRYYILLESVLDLPLSPSPSLLSLPLPPVSAAPHSSSHILAQLAHLRCTLPAHWAHTSETLASDDAIRVTQAMRLHCLERFVSMLVWRGKLHARNDSNSALTEEENEALQMSFACARDIVAVYLCTATKGLLTYYGVHVIHQLTQAGRTLVAVLLSAKAAAQEVSRSHSSSGYPLSVFTSSAATGSSTFEGGPNSPSSASATRPGSSSGLLGFSAGPSGRGQDDIQALVAPSLEALRSCVTLLKKFSVRYVCGMRNGDLLEEFCRLSNIPLSSPSLPSPSVTPPLSRTSLSPSSQSTLTPATPPQTPAASRPPWLRPITKKRRLSCAPTPRSTSSGEELGNAGGSTGGSDFLPASPVDDLDLSSSGDIDMQYSSSHPGEHASPFHFAPSSSSSSSSGQQHFHTDQALSPHARANSSSQQLHSHSHATSHSRQNSNGASASHHLLTSLTPELLNAELVNLLNDGSFDLGVGLGFNGNGGTGLGGIDSLWGGMENGRDMGIIATP